MGIEEAWANTSRASELRASMHEEELTKKLREKGEEKDIEIISDQSSDIEMEDTEQTDEKGWTKVGRKSTARKSYTNQTEKKGETLENRSSVNDTKKNTIDRNIADMSRNRDRTMNNVKAIGECRYYLKGNCRRGEHCRYEHRELCEIWKVEG